MTVLALRRTLIAGTVLAGLVLGIIAPPAPAHATTQDAASALLRNTPSTARAETARRALTHQRAQVGGIEVRVGADGAMTWTDPDRRGRSWMRLLHSHQLVGELAVLARSDEPRAAELAMGIVRSWEVANPRRRPIHPMAWNDETSAQRLLHWVELHATLVQLGRPANERRHLERAMAQHVRELLDPTFHRAGTNHGMFMDRAILAWAASSAGAADPTVADARRIASRRLFDYLTSMVSSDGVHLEHSPAYHQVIAANTSRFVAFYDALGDRSRAATLRELHQRMLSYATHVLQPDGSFPQVGDTMLLNVPARWLFDDPGYRYAVSRGTEGVAPSSTTAVFPTAGYAVVRDAWRPGGRGTYLHLAAAYHNDHHKHADDLSLWVYHDGELLTEAGAHGYEFGTPLVTYGYGATAHNVVLLDGRGVPVHDGRVGATRITGSSHAANGRVTAVAGRTTRLPGARTWHRDVRYDRAGQIRVTDRLVVPERRTATVVWHTAPGVRARSRDGAVELLRGGVAVGRLRVTVDGAPATLRSITAGATSPVVTGGWRLGGGPPTEVTTLRFSGVVRERAELITTVDLF